ncbi:MAG: hypothetical protein L0229_03570 [Blastocatellia bacterium]|nr:hypothetical protein [Blastocatellia bacterium]
MARLKLEPKYITDSRGVRTAVVLDIKQYEKSLDLVEEVEDAEYVKSVQNEPTRDYQEYRKRRLKIGP